MSRVNFVGASFAVILLALSSQETMAQGELQLEPHPFDSIVSPYPLGPPQKFGDLPPAGAAGFQQASAPRPPQARAARNSQQVRRRPNPISEPRRIAARSPAPQYERRGTGFGPILSLAPRTGERLPFRPFCFPSATLHVQPNQGDNC